MRNNIVLYGSGELSYEIRGIIGLAKQIESFGVAMTWENIGDPVAKGEKIPEWMKAIVKDVAGLDAAYGYSPTEGVMSARQFLTETRNRRGGAQITPADILFFNGLGDAIGTMYNMLRKDTRIIGPSPAYPAHCSSEGAHAHRPPCTYNLDPANHWLPDFEDLENKVRYNDAISGILMINPGNPTGAVFPKETVARFVDIARRYDLFLVSDEIYINMVYGGAKTVPLADVVGEVPAIGLSGMSKELPWPGSRCGWMEFYNRHRDPVFAAFVQSMIQAKMLQVCATTMPQMCLQPIMTHPEYARHVAERNDRYAEKARIAYDRMSQLDQVHVSRPEGAFYLSVVFKDGALPVDGTLPIGNPELRRFIEEKVAGEGPEKRFVYYLMANTGICVVPLSSFSCPHLGFRMTLLEQDIEKFTHIIHTLGDAIAQYCQPATRPLTTVS